MLDLPTLSAGPLEGRTDGFETRQFGFWSETTGAHPGFEDDNLKTITRPVESVDISNNSYKFRLKRRMSNHPVKGGFVRPCGFLEPEISGTVNAGRTSDSSAD
jgi:hypothetical protein